jgi:hypothetical protein
MMQEKMVQLEMKNVKMANRIKFLEVMMKKYEERDNK